MDGTTSPSSVLLAKNPLNNKPWPRHDLTAQWSLITEKWASKTWVIKQKANLNYQAVLHEELCQVLEEKSTEGTVTKISLCISHCLH